MTSITGVVFQAPFWARLKTYVFAPSTFTSAEVTIVIDNGSIAGTYDFTTTDYDNTLGAFVVWTDVPYIISNETMNGSVSARLNGESTTYDITWINKAGNPDNGKPEHFTVNFQKCVGGQSRIWVAGKTSQNLSYDNTLLARLEVGSALGVAPTHITALSDFEFSDFNQADYTESTLANVSGTAAKVKGVLFDLGLKDGGTYQLRLRGSGSPLNDFLDLTVDLTCEGCDTPVILSGEVNCDSVSINGMVGCGSSGNKIQLLFADGTLIKETPLVSVGLGGTFVFQPLNLTSYRGFDVYVVMVNTLNEEVGERVYLEVQDVGCIDPEVVGVPEIRVMDLCKKKCSYQSTLTGTADFEGEVLIFEAPYDEMNPILVATGISNGATWEVKSEDIKPKGKYVAFGIRHDGESGGVVTIDDAQDCEKDCVLVGKFSGVAPNVAMGIMNVYEVPFNPTDLPVVTTKIVNGVWEVKSDALLEDVEYVLYAIRIKNT